MTLPDPSSRIAARKSTPNRPGHFRKPGLELYA